MYEYNYNIMFNVLLVLDYIIRPDYCQSCSGNKGEKKSYCQSRNQCAPSGFSVQISEQLWI